MDKITDFPTVRKNLDYVAQGDGKFRLIAVLKEAGRYAAYVIGDFDSVEEACLRAKDLYDPKFSMTVSDRHRSVIREAGSPRERETGSTTSVIRPTSVTKICGTDSHGHRTKRGGYNK